MTETSVSHDSKELVSIEAELGVETQKKIEITIEKSTLKYKPQPKVIGENIIYINAQDTSFYEKKLSNPLLTVWLLSSVSTSYNYSKKRLIETAQKMNIQLIVMDTQKFDLIGTVCSS